MTVALMPMSNFNSSVAITRSQGAMSYGPFQLATAIEARLEKLRFHANVLGWTDAADRAQVILVALLQRLDNIHITSHTDEVRAGCAKVRKILRRFGSVADHMKDIFGQYYKPKGCYDEYEKAYVAVMQDHTRRSRVGELRYRLASELLDRVNDGWFVVFDTLTVNEDHYQSVFSNGSKAFSNYVRRIERDIGGKIYGSVRAAEEARKQGDQWYRYFAVVERGGKFGRLHLHVVHMCKELPSGSRDPNAGRPRGVLREIESFRRFWPYGNVTPLAVRFGNEDAYGKAGWLWPCVVQDGKRVGMEATPFLRLVNYVVKYVGKSYLEQREDGFRCRMSRNLGMRAANQLVQKLKSEDLGLLLETREGKILRTRDRLIPPGTLIRRAAARESLARMTRVERWEFLRKCRSQPGLLERLRERLRMMSSPSNAGGCGRESTKSSDIFEAEWLRINRLWKELNHDVTAKVGRRGAVGYSG